MLGVLTDAIANPHRVDLVSLPLLGIVLWNLAMYLLLLVGWSAAAPRRDGPAIAAAAAPRRWPAAVAARIGPRARRRDGAVPPALAGGDAAPDGAALEARPAPVRAGWAVGVALSLLTRGLVVEYRVGWESTFLDASQVHAILSFLRLPALLLFPFQPFSVQEVAALQFSQGGGAVAGARWVYMYVALLLVLVVVPRLVLAAFAYWRERMLSRKVPLDLRDRITSGCCRC